MEFHTVTQRSRPPGEAVSFARINARARTKWPKAALVAVNDEAVEGRGEAVLRRAVETAALPLQFKFRTYSTGGAKTGGWEMFPETHLVGVTDKDVGTKDTHINFGEQLDPVDWDEADAHCSRADLCIVLGTSLSLRHCAHFGFLAPRTVIVNLQATPDDHRCFQGLRIWGKCDDVLQRLLAELGVEDVDPLPAWRPRDALSLETLRSRGLHARAIRLAQRIERRAQKLEGSAPPTAALEEDAESTHREDKGNPETTPSVEVTETEATPTEEAEGKPEAM